MSTDGDGDAGQPAGRRPELAVELYRRMLLIRGFEDRVQSALPARRGVRHDAPLLRSGGGRGRRRRRARATATGSPAPTAATATCSRWGRPRGAPRRAARPRDRRQRRPRGLDERRRPRRTASSAASGSSAAASRPRPAPALALRGTRLASRSRTSATAPRTRRTSSSASTSRRCSSCRSSSSARTTATASTRPTEAVTAGRRSSRARRRSRFRRRPSTAWTCWAVRTAAAEVVERVRAGRGPEFIEALTYRFVGHSRSDPGQVPARRRARALEAARSARRRLDAPARGVRIGRRGARGRSRRGRADAR